MYICLLLVLSTSIVIYQHYQNQKKLTLEQEKMYNIIMSKGSIDKDPYNRTISESVAKKFYKIAKKYSINLDKITDNEFDFIYKKYVKYLIQKNQT
jgi:hypothetical protein